MLFYPYGSDDIKLVVLNFGITKPDSAKLTGPRLRPTKNVGGPVKIWED